MTSYRATFFLGGAAIVSMASSLYWQHQAREARALNVRLYALVRSYQYDLEERIGRLEIAADACERGIGL